MFARRPSFWYGCAVGLVLLLGLRQYWPTLGLGLFSDDYLAEAMIEGKYGPPRSPWDLFNFAEGTPEDYAAIQRYGALPWWTPVEFRISFLRPLSSALVHFDRVVFGDALWLHHAHSIGVWVVVALVAARFYRKLFSWPVAALATAVFALDESHHGPAVWLCNRGGLYAMLLGLLGLLAHLRFRTGGGREHAVLSALCLSIGLAFGEWVLPMFAYLAAFEAVGATDSWRKRLLALSPALGLGIAFVLLRAALGYGARASGVYVDPGEDPLGFLLLMLHRVPVLAADLVFTVPAPWWDFGAPWRDRILELRVIPPEIWLKLPGWRIYHVALGVLTLGCVLIALRFCWRGLAPEERAHTRWLALGSLLALTPVVGSFPSSRLTLAACFGFAPLFALFVRQLVRVLLRAPQLSLARFFVPYLLLVWLLRLQLLVPQQIDLQHTVDGFTATTRWVLAAELDPSKVQHQRVFVVNATEFTTTYFFASTWVYFDRPLPRSFYPISVAPFAHDLVRTADNQFRLQTLGGGFLGASSEVHFRPSERRLRPGQVFQLEGMRVRVLAMVEGLPQALELTFDKPLEDPSQVFLTATPAGLRQLGMPKVGDRLRLPRASGPSWRGLQRGLADRRLGPYPEMLRFAPVPWFARYRPDL